MTAATDDGNRNHQDNADDWRNGAVVIEELLEIHYSGTSNLPSVELLSESGLL